MVFFLDLSIVLKRLQISITVADSASAHFNDTSVPSFVRGFHKLSIFRKIAYFWRNFERYNVLGIFFARIQNSNEVQRKVAMLRIPWQIWFWLVVDSAHIAEKAQFGLVI